MSKLQAKGNAHLPFLVEYMQSPLFAYWSTYFEGVLPWIASGLVLFETGIFPNSTGISCLFSIKIKMQLQDIQQSWTNPKKHIIASNGPLFPRKNIPIYRCVSYNISYPNNLAAFRNMVNSLSMIP